MVVTKKEKSRKSSVQEAARRDVARKEAREATLNSENQVAVVKKKRAACGVKSLKKQTKTPEAALQLLEKIVKHLDAGKAEDIVSIDLKGKSSLTDYLVIASGTSSRHVMGLMNNLVQDLKKEGIRSRLSGESGDGNWVVVDLIDVIVHIFTPETRSFYNLEDIWVDASR